MGPRILIGLGAGHCGMRGLAALLSAQTSCKMGVGQPPLMPWKPQKEGPTIRGRIATWKKASTAFVGDVAASYLTYAEEAVEAETAIRMICLERPQEDVADRFRRQAEAMAPTPMNHWSTNPGPGWTQHPVLTPTFPQYEARDLVEGIGRYCAEYAERARDLARRFPEKFRVFDADRLESEAGRRAVLDFAGFPREDQVVAIEWPSPAEPAPASRPLPPLDPRRCAVLVPFGGPILPECEAGLRTLERRGYQVRRVGGYAAIDQARNQMATDALLDGFEETLWIDSDIGFNPDDVETLRRHALPIVCGIYPRKGVRKLACHVLPGTPRIAFGKDGGLAEILYAPGGFLLVRREVYLAIQRKLDLPVCNERFGRPTIPYFRPMVRPTDEGPWYLAEDFAFCDRARRSGFKVWADTRIRLWHVGTYHYGWEDAGIDHARFDTFHMDLDAPEASSPRPPVGRSGSGPARAARPSAGPTSAGGP